MKPNVIIDLEVYEKIMHWVNKSIYEVSGLGTLRVEPDSTLHVVSAMLLPQSNGTTHTDIEADAVNKAMFTLRNEPGELKFWWHSHVMMDVFWSATDHATIKSFGEHDWILATVFNKKREMKSAFYSPNGVTLPWGKSFLFVDDLTTTIGEPIRWDKKPWDEEYEKNVTVGQSGLTWDYRDEQGRFAKYDAKTYGANPSPASSEAGNKTLLTDQRPASRRIVQAISNAWDDYGYDEQDRALIAAHGLTEYDLDYLVDHDFSPQDILDMLQADATMEEIRQMLQQSRTAEEVLAFLTIPAIDDQMDFPFGAAGDLQ